MLIIKGRWRASPGVHQARWWPSVSMVITLQCFYGWAWTSGSGTPFCSEQHSWLRKNRWQCSQVFFNFFDQQDSTETDEFYYLYSQTHVLVLPWENTLLMWTKRHQLVTTFITSVKKDWRFLKFDIRSHSNVLSNLFSIGCLWRCELWQ